MQQKIVITGGPGTGKTTLIHQLEDKGFACTPEISRQVTLQARKNGIEHLFLENPLLFSKLLLEGREQQYIDAENTDTPIVFFDRGIPDVHAYMNHFKTDYPQTYLEKSKTYRYDTIFLLPPWKEIYITDNERYESFELSVSIYKHLKNAYTELGYDIIEVPHGEVAERVDFILKHLRLL
ncbi:MAG TPA: ATPase [Flavobacteriia bacterium]|nr:ATPase [Flavobacteriia bacterium]